MSALDRHPCESRDPGTLHFSGTAAVKALDNSLRSPFGSSLQDDLRAARLSCFRRNDGQEMTRTMEIN